MINLITFIISVHQETTWAKWQPTKVEEGITIIHLKNDLYRFYTENSYESIRKIETTQQKYEQKTWTCVTSHKRPSKWKINLKRCPTSLVTRKMQIKTTKWYSTHIRMSKMKKMHWWGHGAGTGTIIYCWWYKLVQIFWKIECNYLFKLHVGIPMTQQFQSNRNAYIDSPKDRYQNLHSFNICNC